MSRLDNKNGRFNPVFEANEYDRAMLAVSGVWGDWCDYYRYREDASAEHSVYDEPTASGRWFAGPQRLPVIDVIREEGMPYNRDGGLFWTDTLYFKVPYASLTRAGLGEMDIDHGFYTRDRIVYDKRVFRLARIQVHGQIRQHDMTASITCNQLRPDELLLDQQFSAWHRKEYAEGLPLS
ncbi:hypothetical protein AB0G15_05355 [Streptosporangium sp. NPDC023825]|uniref:hypothetical protein n=1 Tax=Streptosporangium sp. NPDC023825 TaxID=3154909 RepID=UPI0034460D18